MRYKLKIQIGNNEPNFGKGVVELLELCDKYGSLSKAYKEMGMSNSKAWKIIKRAQEDLGYELVHTTSGGSLGGGSQLTLEGKKYKFIPNKYLRKYLKMNNEEVLIITFKSIQDVLDLESKTKNGRMIPVPSCVKAGCGMCFMSKDLDEEKWKLFLEEQDVLYEDIVRVNF